MGRPKGSKDSYKRVGTPRPNAGRKPDANPSKMALYKRKSREKTGRN